MILTLLLLQDMEINVFELRTILNRVIARRKHYSSYPAPCSPGCSAVWVLVHVLNLLLPP